MSNFRRAWLDQEYARRKHESIPGFAQGVPLKDGIELLPHQARVIRQLYINATTLPRHPHGIRGNVLAAVMGAGKTITSLVYALSHIPRGPDKLPGLVICSRPLLDMWKNQGIDKFLDPHSTKVLYYHKDFISRSLVNHLTRAQLLEYDLVLTTYETVLYADKTTNAHNDIRVMGQIGVAGQSSKRLHYIAKRTLDQANDASVTGRGILFKTPWPLVIADEPQCFANYTTHRFQAMMSVYGEEYLCLTGTPTRNYDTDIWSLFRWMNYSSILRPKSKTGPTWNMTLLETHNLSPYLLQVTQADVPRLPERTNIRHVIQLSDLETQINRIYLEVAIRVIRQARQPENKMWQSNGFTRVLAVFTRLRQLAVAPHLLLPESKRRNRSKQSKQSKPSKPSKLVNVGLSSPDTLVQMAQTVRTQIGVPETLTTLDTLMSVPTTLEFLEPATPTNPTNPTKSTLVDVDTVIDLTKASLSSSAHVPALSTEMDVCGVLGPSLYRICAERDGVAGFYASKMVATIDIIRSIPVGDKVLVFANFTSTLDLLADVLEEHRIETCMLDGDVRASTRSDVITDFHTSTTKVMLITFPVGSEGLNLTCANHVILLEPWWNNSVAEQSIARAWRYGQTKPVTVHHILSRGTIEIDMERVCNHKQQVADAVLGRRSAEDIGPPPRLDLDMIEHIVSNAQKANSNLVSTRLSTSLEPPTKRTAL